MGEVYFAPAHEPPTLRGIFDALETREPSPWLHIGYTDSDSLGFSFEGNEFAGDVMETYGALDFTMRVSAAFDVPLELIGLPEPPRHRADVVRIETSRPAHGVAPWKRRGLTGRRYRIARRQHARARRAWARSGRPMVKISTFIPTANITVREAPGHTTKETP